jgi:hypothetical protein
MLTEDEIKRIKDSAMILVPDDIVRTVAAGKIKVIEPTSLGNGYTVGYSITHMRTNLDVHHVSISNSKGITDPADAEYMARDILGKGYKSVGSMNLKNVLHFMKFVE